ncbi:MAG: hypothetical protein J2P36_31205, partial [Ktedonobacteraceae bacterium]|nr:hypothetical protein [Ktedonobacteraceae bacterium]
MREHKRNILILTTLTAAFLALGAYIRREIARRGYPSWDACRCNFKTKNTIYLVWHSHNEQRGETIVSHEWGLPLTGAPLWLRRLLHHGSQILATLTPIGHHVERVMLTPQEARQFALMLYSSSAGEEEAEEYAEENSHIIWRHEVLHVPRHP